MTDPHAAFPGIVGNLADEVFSIAVGEATRALGDGIVPDSAIESMRNFTAARLRYTAARYDAEARLNQTIATLYEVQVKASNLSAQRHHTRSRLAKPLSCGV